MNFPDVIGGHAFASRALARQALTHPAAARRDGSGAPLNSERLEFLGDAALGALLAEALFERHPGAGEGELTRRRAALVSRAALARASRALGLPELLDAGDDAAAAARIRATDSAAENAFEAMVGAVWRDAGPEAARAFVLGALGPLDPAPPAESARGRLQELLQAGGGNAAALIEYRTVATTGPAHARRYRVEVRFGGASRGEGEGASLKAASEAAARAALEKVFPVG